VTIGQADTIIDRAESASVAVRTGCAEATCGTEQRALQVAGGIAAGRLGGEQVGRPGQAEHRGAGGGEVGQPGIGLGWMPLTVTRVSAVRRPPAAACGCSSSTVLPAPTFS
jgi:hypothetical protein